MHIRARSTIITHMTSGATKLQMQPTTMNATTTQINGSLIAKLMKFRLLGLNMSQFSATPTSNWIRTNVQKGPEAISSQNLEIPMNVGTYPNRESQIFQKAIGIASPTIKEIRYTQMESTEDAFAARLSNRFFIQRPPFFPVRGLRIVKQRNYLIIILILQYWKKSSFMGKCKDNEID